MKSLFSKVMAIVAGATAFLSISVNNVMAMASPPVSQSASITEITSVSPLYLEHGKSIAGSMLAYDDDGHYSHSSHESHESHSSHSSHYSGY